MKMIEHNETEITGVWLMSQGHMIANKNCQRIYDLIHSHLVEVSRDSSGWEALYRDPNDGRFWEITYPHSEMHGGGPPQLRYLLVDEARRKYGNVVTKQG